MPMELLLMIMEMPVLIMIIGTAMLNHAPASAYPKWNVRRWGLLSGFQIIVMTHYLPKNFMALDSNVTNGFSHKTVCV